MYVVIYGVEVVAAAEVEMMEVTMDQMEGMVAPVVLAVWYLREEEMVEVAV